MIDRDKFWWSKKSQERLSLEEKIINILIPFILVSIGVMLGVLL